MLSACDTAARCAWFLRKLSGKVLEFYLWISLLTLLDTGYMWPWPLTLTLDVSRSNFEIAVSQGLLVWLMWNEKEESWIGYWANCMTLPFDHTCDIDLGVSRSESEIALSQEWDGWLTWNKKDVSHPFMIMILTSVTMVGWADVPDSDQGDFRRRRAVNISSCSYYQ